MTPEPRKIEVHVLLTAKEFAELMGISYWTALREFKLKPTVRIGKTYRMSWETVKKYYLERAV